MCDVTGMGGSSIATAPWTIIVLPMTGYVIDAVFFRLDLRFSLYIIEEVILLLKK